MFNFNFELKNGFLPLLKIKNSQFTIVSERSFFVQTLIKYGLYKILGIKWSEIVNLFSDPDISDGYPQLL